jgi:tetratricopeptide (TPR) repeat protein
MNLYTQVQQSVQDHCAALVDYSKKQYIKESLIGVVVLALMLAGYCGYAWHQKRQNIQAFAGLVEISKSYEQSLAKAREQQSLSADTHKENPWEDTQLLLEAIASANSGSSLSPFFVMYQAQLALDAEHDFDKACELMEKGIRRLSKNSVYYDMFNMKRIKMLLDSPMQNVRDKAVQELEKIAAQKENYYAQEALSTLGAYQAFHGNMDAAIQAWTTLAQEDQSDKSLISSPWVSQAQEKLKTLNIAFAVNN